jgi:hypothetical protein
MTNWTKYNYVCNSCDALVEITTRHDLSEYRGWCACGSGDITLIVYADATVPDNDVTNLTFPQVVKINTNPYN